MEKSSLDLAQIFEPIRADLEKVDEEFGRQIESKVQLIPQIGQYIRTSGGKRMRPAVLLMAARLAGYTGDRGYELWIPVDGAVAKSAAGHVEHLGRQVGADDPTDVRRDRLALMCGAARDLEDEHRRVEWLQMPRDPSREAGIGEERVLTFEGR